MELASKKRFLTKNQKLEGLTEYTRSNHTLNAEFKNKFYEESLDYRLSFLNWKQELWQRKYNEKIGHLQTTLRQLGKSSGKSSQSLACSRLPSAYPSLMVGNAPNKKIANRGNKITARDIQTPHMTNEGHGQLGWDLRNLKKKPESDLYNDEDLFSVENMSLWRNSKGQMLGRQYKSVNVADYDQNYANHVFRSDKKSQYYVNRARYQSGRLPKIHCRRRFHHFIQPEAENPPEEVNKDDAEVDEKQKNMNKSKEG